MIRYRSARPSETELRVRPRDLAYQLTAFKKARGKLGMIVPASGTEFTLNAIVVWEMEFAHDQLATGRKLRVLTIVDTFTRFSPALEPRFKFRGTDVVEVLERVGRQVGFPASIRVDQGTEFVSRDLDLWAYQ
jgi:transposase InsO family protein